MVIEHLRQEFEKRAKRNPSYSLRAFAKSIDLDSSTLSSLLSGKRKLTTKTAQRILDCLELSGLERKELIYSTLKPFRSKNQAYRMIQNSELEVISDWQHYAILSLIETHQFQSSVKFISSKLNIPLAVAIASVERLQKVGLLKIENGQYKLCQNGVMTTQDIPSSALRKAHRQYIEKALYSLDHHSTEDRDISGTTLAISLKKLPQAKKLIHEFRKNLTELLESGKKDEVYRLNIQLYPLKK